MRETRFEYFQPDNRQKALEKRRQINDDDGSGTTFGSFEPESA
jgi:hypothetical protein